MHIWIRNNGISSHSAPVKMKKKKLLQIFFKKARAYRNARLHGGLSNLRILGKLVGCHEVHGEMKLKKI
jgi:hypothetical protein